MGENSSELPIQDGMKIFLQPGPNKEEASKAKEIAPMVCLFPVNGEVNPKKWHKGLFVEEAIGERNANEDYPDNKNKFAWTALEPFGVIDYDRDIKPHWLPAGEIFYTDRRHSRIRLTKKEQEIRRSKKRGFRVRLT